MNYQNERFIGSILEKTEIPRAELFITTKIWKDAMRTDSVREAVEESLENLKIDYLDLVLIHRPLSDYNEKTWHVLEDCRQDGLVKAIGVSNFLIAHLEKIKQTSTTVPAVNQIELHPFFYRKELVEYCESHNIIIEAYSPLTLGNRLDSPELSKIAHIYNKSPAQILLRWDIQHQIIPIPRALSKGHINENIELFDFQIDPHEMEIMDSLNEDYFVIKPDPDEPTLR
jgi:diketogulonate reductase-like aldo/keto reductase